MPRVAHSETEELKTLGQIDDARLLDRSFEMHGVVQIDVVETALDVSYDDPLITRPLAAAISGLHSRSHGLSDMFQGAMTASSGSKSVRDMPEAGLEDRFQYVLG